MVRTALKISEKAANVQREILKAWRTIAEDHLKKCQESVFLEANDREMRAGTGLLYSTIVNTGYHCTLKSSRTLYQNVFISRYEGVEVFIKRHYLYFY